ncbi:DNA utilization protein HofO [Enterobacter hormaechei]|uniref:HofO family protein n=1 Tax=Enterobacter hormaechei TaxID=158836 RepID=UPI003170E84B
MVTQVKPVQPFSPLAFQREDARLVYWKPQQSGGELALDALWSAVPALFSRLALENVRVSAFSITPQGKQLRLSLQLEIGHAQ